MSEHSHHDHDHSHDHPHSTPDTPVDAGSQALAEALRSSFAIVKVVMVLLVLVFLASGFFQVGPQEQAIILRFGKPVGEGKGELVDVIGWRLDDVVQRIRGPGGTVVRLQVLPAGAAPGSPEKTIELKREVPEAMKPRRIQIGNGPMQHEQKQIEKKAA